MRLFLVSIMLLHLAMATGCGYTIQGRVVQSDFSSASFVRDGDQALVDSKYSRGMQGARVRLYRDPGSLGKRLVEEVSTDSRGWFTMSVGEFGAGWMVEKWEVEALMPGSAAMSQLITLPQKPGDRVLLINLAPGDGLDQFEDRNDPYQDYLKYR